MTSQKEPLLKKSITVGEVLSLAIALLGAGIFFYTSVQLRLGALELRMLNSETEQKEYRLKQSEFQDRIENKLDIIKDDINKVKIEVSTKK